MKYVACRIRPKHTYDEKQEEYGSDPQVNEYPPKPIAPAMRALFAVLVGSNAGPQIFDRHFLLTYPFPEHAIY